MMTSDNGDKEAYVWIWLPEALDPIVAGKLETDGQGNIQFNYGRSYLERINAHPPAIAIYEPELPLQRGVLPLPNGLTMPGSIRDAAPDAWGRRVILNKKLGGKGRDTDTTLLSELSYLLESGSDRIGALDFQRSPIILYLTVMSKEVVKSWLLSFENCMLVMPLLCAFSNLRKHWPV